MLFFSTIGSRGFIKWVSHKKMRPGKNPFIGIHLENMYHV